jgi:hypothetical protein
MPGDAAGRRPTTPGIPRVHAAAESALVKGRAARAAVHTRCMARAQGAVALAEYKIRAAINGDRQFTEADERVVSAAADCLELVSAITSADGTTAAAEEWSALVETGRRVLGVQVFIARLAG